MKQLLLSCLHSLDIRFCIVPAVSLPLNIVGNPVDHFFGILNHFCPFTQLHYFPVPVFLPYRLCSLRQIRPHMMTIAECTGCIDPGKIFFRCPVIRCWKHLYDLCRCQRIQRADPLLIIFCRHPFLQHQEQIPVMTVIACQQCLFIMLSLQILLSALPAIFPVECSFVVPNPVLSTASLCDLVP